MSPKQDAGGRVSFPIVGCPILFEQWFYSSHDQQLISELGALFVKARAGVLMMKTLEELWHP